MFITITTPKEYITEKYFKKFELQMHSDIKS